MPTNPPELPKRWRRLYAHVISLEAICPSCGMITTMKRGAWARAYDKGTGIWRCPNVRCERRWYVGVVFWPANRRMARAWDHTLTPGEAMRMREQLSGESREPVQGGGDNTGRGVARERGQVNLVCTCGDGCPVHDGPRTEGDDDD